MLSTVGSGYATLCVQSSAATGASTSINNLVNRHLLTVEAVILVKITPDSHIICDAACVQTSKLNVSAFLYLKELTSNARPWV